MKTPFTLTRVAYPKLYRWIQTLTCSAHGEWPQPSYCNSHVRTSSLPCITSIAPSAQVCYENLAAWKATLSSGASGRHSNVADLAYLLDARYLSLSIRLVWKEEPNAASGLWAGVGSVIAILAGSHGVPMKGGTDSAATSMLPFQCIRTWQVNQAAVSDKVLSKFQPSSECGTDHSGQQKHQLNCPHPNQSGINATRITLVLSNSKMSHTLFVWIEGIQAAYHRNRQHCVRVNFVEKVRPLLHGMKWTHVHKVGSCT